MNDRLWGAPREVFCDALPKRQQRSKYADLYEDILLRLEQTKPTMALVYPLLNSTNPKNVSCAILRLARNNKGPGYLAVSPRADENGSYIIVRRGKNWSK